MKILASAFIILFSCVGSFAQTDIPGCTNPEAVNYNAQATVDDFSCCFEDFYITFTSFSNASLIVFDNQGVIFAEVFFPGTSSVCLSQGCRTFYLQSTDGLLASIEGFDQFGQEYFISTSPGISVSEDFILGEGIVGCMVPGACNYNPLATCYAACEFECIGCTNPNAFNYNPNATVDDGSCCLDETTYFQIQADGVVGFSVYDSQYGLVAAGTYPETQGFCYDQDCFQIYVYSILGEANEVSIIHQGEVVLTDSVALFEGIFFNYSGDAVLGCSDASACNYNPAASCNTGFLCDYFSCYGCTDPTAANFDPDATLDNGSCCSSENYVTLTSNAEGFIDIYSNDFSYVNTVYFTPDSPAQFCLPDGCYVGYIADYYAIPFSFQITDQNGEMILDATTEDYFLEIPFSFNAIEGCPDPDACNYNPAANCWGVDYCDYDCYGCTDSDAANFDPSASIDDGSCCNDVIIIEAATGFSYYITSQDYTFTNIATTQNGQASICVPNGCLLIYLNDLNGNPIDYTITTSNGEMIAEVDASSLQFGPYSFDNDAIEGCADVLACNYNPEANCLSYSSCDYSCQGCTNSDALNYNPDATVENGSCCFDNYYTIQLSGEAYWTAVANNEFSFFGQGQYPQQNGFCLDSDCFSLYIYSLTNEPLEYVVFDQNGNVLVSGVHNNYDAIIINTSAEEIIGCTDPSACNYNPNVTCGNWFLCDYSCYGCTDTNAQNFNADATIDNGSCCYSDWYNITLSGPGFWYVYNSNDSFFESGSAPNAAGWCGTSSCFQLEIYSFTNETLSYTITNAEGVIVTQGETDGSNYFSIGVSVVGEIAGCTSETACNYDPDATCDTGVCSEYCFGCTDETALNFDSSAQFDDGSCIYQAEAPMIALYVDEFAEEGIYYVLASVMNLGNGAPYLFGTPDGNQMTMISSTGQYALGPFSCGEGVTVSVNSTSLEMMQFMEVDLFNGNCITLNTEENTQVLESLQLYPNPANDQITLAGLPDGSFEIIITDMMGRVILEQQWNNTNQGTLNVSAISNGVYQLSLHQADKMQTKKLIIKR